VKPTAIWFALTAAFILQPSATAQQHAPTKDPFVVVQDGKYGYISHRGEVIIRPQFVWGTDFEDGFGTVYVCGRIVSVNEAGQILPLKYSKRRNGLSTQHSGDKVGFVDAAGQFTIAPTFADALLFSDGFAAVKLGDFWGFIDTTGRQVIPPTFQAAYYFREGVATAMKDGGYVLVDKTGSILARGFKQLHGVVSEGRVPVSRDEKYGYLDLHGKVMIPLIYEDADSFNHGLAPVKKAGKWGYIDSEGRVAIPFIFDKAGVFGSNLAPAQSANQSGFIDRSGTFAIHLRFEYAPGFLTTDADGTLAADTDVSRFWTSDGAFGYVTTAGEVIWGPTQEAPDHAPLLGWSEEDKVASCHGVAEPVRKAIAGFSTH
jgi:hypothetical protein